MQSRKVIPARTQPQSLAWHRLSELDGFDNAAVCLLLNLAPSAAAPTGRYLSFAEREQIALGSCPWRRCSGDCQKQLGRSPSTISREVRRNAATRGGGLEYRAHTAQWHADRAAMRPKPAKLLTNPVLREYVQERLAGNVAETPAWRIDRRTASRVEGPPTWAKTSPPMVEGVEPGADRQPSVDGFPRRHFDAHQP